MGNLILVEPDTELIREVMEARIEGFGVEGKEVAKRGALMGRRFTRDAIERIWEKSDQDMTAGFERLRATEAIYEETSRFFNGEMESVFRHSRLHEAVRSLPLNHREVILLLLEELSHAEIAEVLGITENNVAVRLTRARAALRTAMEADHDDR